MKNLKHLFTALLLLSATMAFAEEATINGIKYDIITKAKQAKVISGGNYSGNIVIPETIEHNGVTYSVTSIGDEAFKACSGLTSITIPNSVTSIGGSAFSGCSGLTSIEIPNSVTSIGHSAVRGCSGLTSITIPNSVTSIGEWAFYNCSGLTSITIGNSVTSIERCTFFGCSGLTSVTIPNSVTSIGDYAFRGCSGLTSVTIPNSVTSIGGEGAFYGCTGLASVTIGNGVTSIGYQAFYGCTGLTSIEIPNSVTSIGESAFYHCSGLTSVTIPNSVTSIGKFAFEDCFSLTSVTIDNSVTSIGLCAFQYCSGLTSVTIGSGVTSIGSYAFNRCENLADVYCLAINVPTTNSGVFNESYPEYMTLYVPAEAISNYKKTAPWSSFGTIVALNSGSGEGGGVVTTPKCADPTISYNKGTLSFDCATANAEFVSDVTCSDINKFDTDRINFSTTYNISVYAMATGYDNSNTVNATLCWIECNCNSNNGGANIISVPATAVLITSNNGTLSINCSLDGESVEIYTTSGTLIGTTTIANGNATIQTGLTKGSVVIVKIGNKSVKVILN